VVMPFGYPLASRRFENGSLDGMRNDSLFMRDLFDDIIPVVESTYRVTVHPNQRGIAGASMSGLQALTIGLAHLERFHWIAGFSALGGLGPNPDFETAFADVWKDPASADNKLRLLWFACGNQEKRVLALNQQFSDMLDKRQVHHRFIPVAGWAHQSQLWRRNLHELAPLLFR